MKYSTAGNGNLKQTIYKLYGKDMADSLIEIDRQGDGIRLTGYLGKPQSGRSNRNYELYFLNGRFIKSNLVSRALEEGYKSYLMQHKYPFCVLMMEVEPSRVDVNVHPAKMEVRFTEEMRIYEFLTNSVKAVLDAHEMIPEIALIEAKKEVRQEKALEPFQKARMQLQGHDVVDRKAIFPIKTETTEKPKVTSKDFFVDFDNDEEVYSGKTAEEAGVYRVKQSDAAPSETAVIPEIAKEESMRQIFPREFEVHHAEQMDFFSEKILSEASRKKFRILGQAFDTYWVAVWEDKLLILDQHAAHEKVKYERIMKAVENNEIFSQNLYPPLVLSLSGKEQEILERYQDTFAKLGFELEYFGGKEITIRSTPIELFGNTIKSMFLEVLDELSETGIGRAKSVEERIATMACKAAVKGNMRMSMPEMEALLDELLTLENKVHNFCWSGRIGAFQGSR